MTHFYLLRLSSLEKMITLVQRPKTTSVYAWMQKDKAGVWAAILSDATELFNF